MKEKLKSRTPRQPECHNKIYVDEIEIREIEQLIRKLINVDKIEIRFKELEN